jgi:hypothetical protein
VASAESPAGAWTSPAPASSVDDTPVAYLEAPQKLAGYAEFRRGVAGVAFTLVKDAANPGEPCSAAGSVPPQSVTGGGDRVEFAFEASFPCNRRYQVRATAAVQRPFPGDTPLVMNLWVAVAIPAAPVTGLAADLGTDRTLTLHWDDASHEVDFQGFEVRRAVGDGDFERLDEVASTSTSYTDAGLPEAGVRVRYQVVGLRPGPDAGTTVYGAAGSPVEVTAPAAGAAPDGGGGDATGTGRPTVAGGGPVAPTGQGQQSAHREFQAPATRGITTPTTADTGYQERLPFQKPSPAAEAGDSAAIARLDDEGEGDSQRQTTLLVAGASTAFSWAMALRFLTRRAVVGL